MNIKKIFGWKNVLLILLITVAVAAPSTAAYIFYTRWRSLRENPQQAAREETAAIIKKVSGFIELPTDEEPTVAVITDTTGLSSQPFFARAKNGDKIIIYTKAAKAILYRPAINRIIEVGPLVVDQGNQPATPSAGPQTERQPTPTRAVTTP